MQIQQTESSFSVQRRAYPAIAPTWINEMKTAHGAMCLWEVHLPESIIRYGFVSALKLAVKF